MNKKSRQRFPGKKERYKVKNWKAYNQSLCERGNITLWIKAGSEQRWYHKQRNKKKRGRQPVYSSVAIEIGGIIRMVYHLGYRQTEGFLSSVVRMMGMQVSVPDYSTFNRRMKKMKTGIKNSKKAIADIVVDSTGLKVYGEGEWKVRQHGYSKRRSWRKFHIGLDGSSKEVVAVELTANDSHDSDVVESLLNQYVGKVKNFKGDGAYDKFKVYRILEAHNIRGIIPPQKNARIRQHGNALDKPLARDETIRDIRRYGRKGWKKRSKYHERSSVENFFFRYKTLFGERLRSRITENERTEVLLGCKILNRMTQLGMPETVKVKYAA